MRQTFKFLYLIKNINKLKPTVEFVLVFSVLLELLPHNHKKILDEIGPDNEIKKNNYCVIFYSTW